MEFKNFFPVVSIFPSNTFKARLFRKIRISRNYYREILNSGLRFFRLMGSREVSVDEVGNATLVLNANSPIGKRGDVFFVFKDDGIYREVLKYGKCEAELSEFIADVINDADYKITFIDLGANSGIISRQVLERTDKFINIFAVEPLEELCLSINKNLAKFNRNLKLTVFQNALVSNDVSDDEVEFFVDSRSVGNSSLLAQIAPPPLFNQAKSENSYC